MKSEEIVEELELRTMLFLGFREGNNVCSFEERRNKDLCSSKIHQPAQNIPGTNVNIQFLQNSSYLWLVYFIFNE